MRIHIVQDLPPTLQAGWGAVLSSIETGDVLSIVGHPLNRLAPVCSGYGPLPGPETLAVGTATVVCGAITVVLADDPGTVAGLAGAARLPAARAADRGRLVLSRNVQRAQLKARARASCACDRWRRVRVARGWVDGFERHAAMASGLVGDFHGFGPIVTAVSACARQEQSGCACYAAHETFLKGMARDCLAM